MVLDQPEKTADKVLLDYKAPVAAAIMLLMIAMMVFDFIPVAPVTAVIIAGLLTVFAGCFRNVEAAYKTINWESIVLIAAMMPMSTALEKTGASALVSQGLVDSLGSMGPTALLAGIYFTTSLMTMFISNTATAVLMAPIALVAAQQVGGWLYVHGLREGRFAVADHHRRGDDLRASAPVPVLILPSLSRGQLARHPLPPEWLEH